MSKAKSKTKVEKADFEDIVDVIEEELDDTTGGQVSTFVENGDKLKKNMFFHIRTSNNSELRKVFQDNNNFSIVEIKEKNIPHSFINKNFLKSIA